MQGMILATGVLILTPALLVGAATIWFIRSERRGGS